MDPRNYAPYGTWAQSNTYGLYHNLSQVHQQHNAQYVFNHPGGSITSNYPFAVDVNGRMIQAVASPPPRALSPPLLASKSSKVKENIKPTPIRPEPEEEARPSKKASSSTSKPKKVEKAEKGDYDTLWDVELDGEHQGSVPVYDDCNEIRRKIRALQKTSSFKVTHWLKDIGDINANSLHQFLKQSGPSGGAGNTVYYHAYVYFEKKRIFEGKKKSTKRIENERKHPGGFELRTRTHMWVRA